MPLTQIEYGSLASSETINDNFEYLDDRVTTVAGDLTNTASAINSNIASMNSTFTNQNESIMESISDLETYAQDIRTDLDSKNSSPDYSNGIGISMPYTASQNGYVYAGVEGVDNVKYVKVNGNIVHGHCGYSGGKAVYSGSLFRVCAGDTVTCERTWGSYYFYPLKGNV